MGDGGSRNGKSELYDILNQQDGVLIVEYESWLPLLQSLGFEPGTSIAYKVGKILLQAYPKGLRGLLEELEELRHERDSLVVQLAMLKQREGSKNDI